MTRQEQLMATVEIVAAAGAAVRDLGQVPAGELYTQMMVPLPWLTADNFEQIVRALIATKLIKRENHLLTWVGPKQES